MKEESKYMQKLPKEVSVSAIRLDYLIPLIFIPDKYP